MLILWVVGPLAAIYIISLCTAKPDATRGEAHKRAAGNVAKFLGVCLLAGIGLVGFVLFTCTMMGGK